MPRHKKQATSVGLVPYYHYKNKHEKPLLVFMHGFGVKPERYERLLTLCAKKFDVIAPSLAAINIYDPQPTTLDQYVELALEFMDRAGISPEITAGHSFGASMVYGSSFYVQTLCVIGISPVLPVHFGFFGYLKGTYKIAQDAMNDPEFKSHAAGFIPEYALNLLKKPWNTVKTVKEISHNGYALDETTLDPDAAAVLIQCTKDQFFALDQKQLKQLGKKLPNLEIVDVDFRHDYPLANPAHAAEYLCKYARIRSY